MCSLGAPKRWLSLAHSKALYTRLANTGDGMAAIKQCGSGRRCLREVIGWLHITHSPFAATVPRTTKRKKTVVFGTLCGMVSTYVCELTMCVLGRKRVLPFDFRAKEKTGSREKTTHAGRRLTVLIHHVHQEGATEATTKHAKAT